MAPPPVSPTPPDLPLPPTYGPASEGSDAARLRQAVLNEFLVQLGGAMTVAGDSVDRIRSRLMAISRRNGVRDIEIVALPTALLIETGYGPSARVHLSSHHDKSLRFDQITEVYRLAQQAEEGEVDPTDGLVRLHDIATMHSTVRWAARVIGHGVISIGLGLLLQPSWFGLGLAGVLGMLVGLLHLPRLPSSELVFSVAAAFGVSSVVFLLTPDWLDTPMRTLIPPLVILLPGGVLTIGTVELAAGQIISGATRLIYGIMRLALLAFGVVSAATLLEVPQHNLEAGTGSLGGLAPWLGVMIYAVGVYMHFSAPRATLPWILVVMGTAYGGELIGAHLFDARLSGFFGALLMTPLVLWIDKSRYGPPALITFLPGFWMLVPGSGGLMSATEFAAVDQQLGLYDLSLTFTTIMSIALGVLVGTAAYRAATTSMRTIADTIPSGYRTGH